MNGYVGLGRFSVASDAVFPDGVGDKVGALYVIPASGGGNPYYLYPFASYTVRHCDGTYDNLIPIHNTIDANLWLEATRTMIPSSFSGDSPGTVFAGGFDVMKASSFVPWNQNHTNPQNTNWLYRGTPQQ